MVFDVFYVLFGYGIDGINAADLTAYILLFLYDGLKLESGTDIFTEMVFASQTYIYLPSIPA